MNKLPINFMEEISITFRVDMEGIRLRIHMENGNIDVYHLDGWGPNLEEKLDDTSAIYWVGCIYAWYGQDESSYWCTDDYFRAGQCARRKKMVPSYEYLIKACNITTQTGVGPCDYNTMILNMDMIDFANRSNQEWREGAD